MLKIAITPEVISGLLTTGNEIRVQVTEGLPTGARLESVAVGRKVGDPIELYFLAPGEGPLQGTARDQAIATAEYVTPVLSTIP